MVNTHFTCIGKGHGAPAIPATREEWEKMRGENWLAKMCERIRNGQEELKARLPIWTPSCAEFANNHRAVKDALKPLRRVMLDFDEKGHSQEILERSMQLQQEGKWEILLVEESVRRGTHVLITLPEGMTLQEAQQRFSDDVGFVADPALKDIARCIYMVPEEFTLYVNERIFSPQSATESHGVSNNPADEEKEKTSVKLRVLRGEKENTSTYPQTYEDIPYSQIVETLEEQMGGLPDVGSRNNFIFSMACHLRYICDDNPDWIAQVLPTYGEEKPKWLNTIKSACQRIQTKAMPRIVKRTLAICKNRMETDEGDQNQPPQLRRRLPPLI